MRARLIATIETADALGEGVLWRDSDQTAWWTDIIGQRLQKHRGTGIGTGHCLIQCLDAGIGLASADGIGLVHADRVGVKCQTERRE